MSRVSVIVPLYNARATLDRCVKSILLSAPPDAELILVDDGSNDGSGDACDAWVAADARVRALHQPNGGVSAARNRGLAEASGEYVAFVDADDTVSSTYLSEACDLMERMEADIVIGGVREIYRARVVDVVLRAAAPIALEESKQDALIRQTVSNMTGAVDELSNGISTDGLPAKLYRQSTLMACGAVFSEGVFFGEDVLFNLLVFSAARRVVIAPEVWYDAYRAEGSLCYRFDDALFDSTRLFFVILETFIDSTPDRAKRDALTCCACFRRVNWLLMLVKQYTFSSGTLSGTQRLRRVRAFFADEGYRRALSRVNRGRLSAFKRLFVLAALHDWVGCAMALAGLSWIKTRVRGYRPRGRSHG